MSTADGGRGPAPGGHHRHAAREERAPSGWSVLAHALRPRVSRAQVVTGVLCALLGFAVVTQVRQASTATLSTLRQDDLVRLLDETTTRGDELARELTRLEAERDELLSDDSSRQAAQDAARRSAETQGILTGRLPAVGPGVVVTVADPDGRVKPATLLNLLEELRNAGAEAMQVGDVRLTASSAFTGGAGEVLLDGQPLQAPYRWVVIGDPDTIATALEIPGGALAAVRRDGGDGGVLRREEVEVTALATPAPPTWATPLPAEDG
ncbi:DUF881 domain-containing protein [Cellulomonas marina]|uniref:Uncharacterized conserved protein YlxW, UPF0749 family n=1 Tax=Cellulomonas marina TaxID=988821 RepID=A0A1I0ZYW7_9CELL|nr:DUF881 domain-containing protein [Cellulomonas marina]GIG30557.1 hypothetical protein Cma02nite_31570 [Cellulomonas marina]SFB29488.1 Uncharacterized conserved protein YlxW, UPF0749 family [Cellulomonas marina]